MLFLPYSYLSAYMPASFIVFTVGLDDADWT